ncbi:MAG TPA: tRNA (N(6)-L-threonylcarbamoyladenosine(37)-C(2))-methylthiotransferase MtaB [Candidatus Cloacimonadota bacterium]|nr:tRNA (N(6)-L-threonylcarbamoyladenosine(37)-C(2))-methylthiotransferase MtaB [Candidatus Cloacimonadota bacterium]
MIRIAVATLGCKTNQSETAAILGQFKDHQIVDFDQEADIYLINTCTVTNRTDYKSRYLIRKALAHKGRFPRAKVVVTGCYSQRSRDEVLALGDVDLVVDNQNKLDLALLLDSGCYSFQDIMTARDFHYVPQTAMHERSRAFQKIQDGCDYYCSYCAVPYARGHKRSAALSDVLTQSRLFVQNGYREIVLGGVNLGLYRDQDKTLKDVITAMQNINGLEIIRLSSLEPQLFDPQLLDLIANTSKVAPHFHIALQSGSDTILKRMKRVYDTALVANLIQAIKTRIPDAAIGFDVICGFPGETEDEFRATYEFLSSLPITYLHVFSYSKRKGTPAAAMADQIPGPLKHQRSSLLSQLSDSKKLDYTQFLISNQIKLKGVIEEHTDDLATLLSDHFIRAYKKTEALPGSIAELIPVSFCEDGVI